MLLKGETGLNSQGNSFTHLNGSCTAASGKEDTLVKLNFLDLFVDCQSNSFAGALSASYLEEN